MSSQARAGGPLIGVFQKRVDAEEMIERMRAEGVAEEQIRCMTKSTERQPFHLFSGHRGEVEKVENELLEMGCTPDAARFYRGEFEIGHTLVMVDPGDHQTQVRAELNRSGAYTYATYAQGLVQEERDQEGAMTPGMRPEDSSQNGIATNASGVQAAEIDPALVEDDLRNLERRRNERRQL